MVREPAAARAAVLRVAELTVPKLADYCLVYWVEGQELKLTHRVGQAAATAAMEWLVSGLHIRLDSALLARLAEKKESLLSPVFDPHGDGPLQQEHELLHVLEKLNTKSLLLVPLAVHEPLFGLLIFGTCHAERRFDARDRALVDEMAFRCALALESAQLYDRAQAAVQLQENLLAIVSHDLRNPLNTILLSAKMISPSYLSLERHRTRKQVDMIARSVERMNRLNDHLLTATTIEAGHFTLDRNEQDAAALIDEALQITEPLATAKKIKLDRQVAGPLGSVWCDRERVLQVFSNLLGNAIKFTPEGGRVSLAAEPLEIEVRFTVTDTGPGIAVEQRPHLFDRYWKGDAPRDRYGVGLGLFIAKSVIDAHGARLWLDSELSHGARFSFTLPRPVAR